MVLMIPTKVIKVIFQENVFFMEIWVSRCIDQCLAVLPGHGIPKMFAFHYEERDFKMPGNLL